VIIVLLYFLPVKNKLRMGFLCLVALVPASCSWNGVGEFAAHLIELMTLNYHATGLFESHAHYEKLDTLIKIDKKHQISLMWATYM
jgi:hypothetical protein